MDAFTARDVDELLQKRRTAARERAAKRKADAYAADPLLKETDDEIALLKVEKFRAMRNGQPYEQTDKKLAELKKRYIARLAEHGLTPEDLEAQYTCPICKDTGYTKDGRCSCCTGMIYELMYRGACLDPAGEQRFENCKSDIFGGDDEAGCRQRAAMEKLTEAARSYAEHFCPGKSDSLVFTGPTGTGKTFLANCIAAEVLRRGFSVLAVSSYALCEAFRNAAFNNGGELARLCRVDLLVIDELGMEPMLNNITVEMLFTVINERMRSGLPCIVTTNLTPSQLKARYTERITSRLFDRAGSRVLRFEGNDVRLQPQRAQQRKRGDKAAIE